VSDVGIDGAAPTRAAEHGSGEAKDHTRFGLLVAGLVVADWFTKALVQRFMQPYQQIDLIGEYVRLTYIFNPGAAFGIHLGDASRAVFLVLSLVALVALAAMYRLTPASRPGRLTAIALIIGGAQGNLLDRVRHAHGVVDFMDIGVGTVRWPVFNIADVAVTAGAIVLALSLWREEPAAR
jgi:signal peptidase II